MKTTYMEETSGKKISVTIRQDGNLMGALNDFEVKISTPVTAIWLARIIRNAFEDEEKRLNGIY